MKEAGSWRWAAAALLISGRGWVPGKPLPSLKSSVYPNKQNKPILREKGQGFWEGIREI